jgi:ubiquitin C-terminal hydrolase
MNEFHFFGLKNPHNLCYGNSLFQQLYHMKPFRDDILLLASSSEDVDDKNEKEEAVIKAISKFAVLFVNDKAESTKDEIPEAASILSFYKALSKALKLPKENIKKMRDISEFFSEIIKLLLIYTGNSMESTRCLCDLSLFSIDGISRQYLLSHFTGELTHSIQPSDLSAYSIEQQKTLNITRNEKFYYLSLGLQPALSVSSLSASSTRSRLKLEDAIHQFVQPKSFKFKWKIEQHSSEGEVVRSKPDTTNVQLPSIQTTQFRSLPSYLIFYLRRFQFNFSTQTKEKYCQSCDIPVILDMKQFMNHKSAEGAEINELAVPSSFCYRLSGLIVHLGDSAEEGHYVSLIADKKEWNDLEPKTREIGQAPECEALMGSSLLGTSWILFNDERISHFQIRSDDDLYDDNKEDNEDTISLEEIKENAVMLFYERLL